MNDAERDYVRVMAERDQYRAEVKRLREALSALALKWAPHSGSCCTFDESGAVIVTPESCKCHEPERTAQRLLGMYGKPDGYRAALAAPAASPEVCAREGCGHTRGLHDVGMAYPDGPCFATVACPCTGYQPVTASESCAREGCGRSLADHYTAEPFAFDCPAYQPATASAAATSEEGGRG